jgi:hypothetical protein
MQESSCFNGHLAATRRATFKGLTDDMGGNVFQCYEEQDDRRQYAKTIEALDAYAKKNLSYTADLAPLFATKMTAPSIERPVTIAEGADKLEEMIFAEEVKEYVKRTRSLKSNLATIYAVAWGQCSADMKARVKTHEGYETKSVANDCVWLLRQIRSVTLQFNESKDGFMSLLDAQHRFLACKQSAGQSADEYAEQLLGWADTIETHGGAVAANYKLIAETDPAGNVRSSETRRDMARERTIATALIRNADASRYGTLITDLANKYAMGRDEYPTDITSAKSLLVNYRTPTKTPAPRTGPPRSQHTVTVSATEATGATLAQRAATPVAGTDGVTRVAVTCFLCNQPGHMQGECPTGQQQTANTVNGTTLT